MFKTALMQDMLESIKRLNKELDSRCNFESNLITCIKTRDEQIEKLNTHIEKVEVRAEKLNKFLTEHVLPANRQIVFNTKTEEFEMIEKQ